MKIGIITVQKAPNYGAVLQCYALWKYLELQGYDCEVIDLCREIHKDFVKSKRFSPYKILSTYNRIRKFLADLFPFISTNRVKKRQFERKYKQELDVLNIKFAKFNSCIKYSKKYVSVDALYQNPPDYDIYLTGSDQLWNPTQNYCIEPYFLTFVQNKGKKVSYATSIGQTVLPNKVINDYIKWLNTYTYISVREQSAVDMLQPYIEKDIYRTIDPTFLLKRENWEDIALEPLQRSYVFCFTLYKSMDLLLCAKRYASLYNKKMVFWMQSMDETRLIDANTIGRIDISPEEWLGYVKNADVVFTDSFHGSVFSIIYNRQFYAYIPLWNNRGSRITDLLDLLQLNDRLITDLDNVPNNMIDYINVDRILCKEREKSVSYIKKAFYD